MKNKLNKNTHEHINTSSENIKTAFYLNLVFSILEVIGGALTNSISIISDAIHDFADSISIGVSYLFEKKSHKLPDQKYTYGYLRYSLLGAIITCIVLLIGSILIIYNSIPRLIHPESINHDAMIIFAIFGVLINGYAAYRTSKSKRLNEKIVNLHMLEDVLGWIAVLIGSIFIKLFDLTIIDPILSLLIAIYLLYHAFKNIKNVFNIFMEKVPDNVKLADIENDLKNKYDSIKNIHHTHIWSIDGINNYMTCHVLLNKKLDENEIIKLKHNIKKTLIESEIYHTTLEIEYINEKCDNKNCKIN